MSEARRAYGTDVLGREFELPGFRGQLLDMESAARRLPGRLGDRLRAEWLLSLAQDYERIEIEIDGRRHPLVRRHRFARRAL